MKTRKRTVLTDKSEAGWETSLPALAFCSLFAVVILGLAVVG